MNPINNLNSPHICGEVEQDIKRNIILINSAYHDMIRYSYRSAEMYSLVGVSLLDQMLFKPLQAQHPSV